MSNISGVNWGILGPVRFTLLSGLGIEIRGIIIDQPNGFSAPEALFKLHHLNLRLDMLALLDGGRIEIREIGLYGARIYAVLGPNGQNSLERMLELIRTGQVQAPEVPIFPILSANEQHNQEKKQIRPSRTQQSAIIQYQTSEQTENISKKQNIANSIENNPETASAPENTEMSSVALAPEQTAENSAPTVPPPSLGQRIKNIINRFKHITVLNSSFYIEQAPKLWVRADHIDLTITSPPPDTLSKKESFQALLQGHVLAPSLWVDVPNSPIMEFTLESKNEINIVEPSEGWGDLPFEGGTLWLRLLSDPYKTKPNSIFGKAKLELNGTIDLKKGHIDLPLISISADGLETSGNAEIEDLFGVAPITRAELDVSNFSQTRWLHYARRLPLGLRHTLNKASAKLFVEGLGTHFTFNAPLIIGAGTSIRGKGVVPDFRKPSLSLEFWTDYIDANNIIPELAPAGKQHGYSEPSPLDMPAPIPFPQLSEAPPDEDAFEFGFDVVINAVAAKINLFTANDVRLRIFPDKDLVAITANAGNIYGGSANLRLDIDKDIGLRLNAQNVNANPPSVLLFDDIRASGNVNLDLNGVLVGRTLSADTINASAPRGLALTVLENPRRSGPNDIRTPFSRVQATGRNFVFEREGRRMRITGNLNGTLSGPFNIGDIAFNSIQVNSAAIKQPVFMNLDSRQWSNLERIAVDAQARGAITTFGARRDLDARVRGDFGLQLNNKGLSLDNMNFEAFNSTLSGTFRTERLWGFANPQPTLYEGNIRFQTSRLSQFMRDYGLQSVLRLEPPRDRTLLSRANLSGAFSLQGEAISLRNLTGTFDETSVRLNLSRSANANRSSWDVNLNLGVLDIDRYRPPSRPNTPRAQPWNLQALRSMDMNANVRVEHMRLLNLDFRELSLPLTIRNGRITSNPINARLYSGPLLADFSAQITAPGTAPVTTPSQGRSPGPVQSMNSRLNLRVDRVNFGPLVNSVAGQRFADGTMRSQLDLSGNLRSLDDLPSALSGSWSIEVLNGRYFTNPQTDRTGSSFSTASASGTMRSGVLNTNNFSLSSGLISMRGGGEIDLNNQTINQSINVILVKGPTLPVHITGSLSAPEINVRALAAVPQTVFQVTRGILTLPLRIFGYTD